MRNRITGLALLSLLAACESQRKIPDIVQDILSAEHASRQKLAVELGEHGKAAVTAWIQLLKNEKDDYNLYVIAADGLRALGAEAVVAVPELTRFLRDGFPGMTLAEMTLAQRVKTRDAARRHACAALESIGVAAVPALRALLSHATARTRQETVVTLGRIGREAKAAVPDLIRLLGDADKAVATMAAWSLGEIQSASADVKKALVAAFEDNIPLVRFEAVRAMGKFGKDAADVREEIRKLTGDPDLGVREVAFEALGRVPAPADDDAASKK